MSPIMRIRSRSITAAILRPKSNCCSLIHKEKEINCVIQIRNPKKKNYCYPLLGGGAQKEDKEGGRGGRGNEKGEGMEPIMGTSSKLDELENREA